MRKKRGGLQNGVQVAGALEGSGQCSQRCTRCGNVGYSKTTCDEVCQLPIVYQVEPEGNFKWIDSLPVGCCPFSYCD